MSVCGYCIERELGKTEAVAFKLRPKMRRCQGNSGGNAFHAGRVEGS